LLLLFAFVVVVGLRLSSLIDVRTGIHCLRCCCSCDDTLVVLAGEISRTFCALIYLILLYVALYEYKYYRRFLTESEKFFFTIFNTVEIQDLLRWIPFLGFPIEKLPEIMVRREIAWVPP
jgi:hypothetical protein